MGKTRGTNNFGREVSCKIAKYSIKLDYSELTICNLKVTYIISWKKKNSVLNSFALLCDSLSKTYMDDMLHFVHISHVWRYKIFYVFLWSRYEGNVIWTSWNMSSLIIFIIHRNNKLYQTEFLAFSWYIARHNACHQAIKCNCYVHI